LQFIVRKQTIPQLWRALKCGTKSLNVYGINANALHDYAPFCEVRQ
jgi:hypothetical protein